MKYFTLFVLALMVVGCKSIDSPRFNELESAWDAFQDEAKAQWDEASAQKREELEQRAAELRRQIEIARALK